MKKLLLTLIVSLALSGSILAQSTHWPEYNNNAFETFDILIAFVQIDGNYVTASDNWADLEIASFFGDECRGADFMTDYTADGDPYPILESGVSYTTVGQAITFKMYDHANDILYETCTVFLPEGTAFEFTTGGGEHNELYFDYDQAMVLNFASPAGPVAPVTVQWEDTLGTTGVTQNVIVPDNTTIIIPDGYVAYADDITFGSNSNLVIEDGGQLICNTPVDATVIKNISSAKAGNDTWYTISSPVDSPLLDAVTNLVNSTAPDNYAMFLYDEPSHHWMNQKLAANAGLFNTLTNGRGYLYWNNGENLEFNGTLNVGDVTYPISYTDGLTDIELRGFNLIGNPFPHNISKGTGAAINDARLTEGYYVLDNNYEWQVKAFGDPIKPTQGIIVEATQAFNLTITDTDAAATAKRGTTGFIELSVSNGSRNDVTYALFSDKAGLTKINRLNAETPMIYFQRENGNFAIATIDNEVKDLAVNFEAGTTGTYDLKVRTDAQFDYLHLIDNMTGNDIDLLATPSYTFDARTTDYASRFKLVFKASTGIDENTTTTFAYFNGESWSVNNQGNATLQVVDMTGRVISNTQINGNATININETAGIYMLRLVNGDNIMIQKIVVR